MMKPGLNRHGAEFIHWAKTRQAARYNLATSGLRALTRTELALTLDDIELSGPSFYGWSPLIEALAEHLDLPRDRICFAHGTSMANHLAMAVCVQAGDEVLVEDPTYGPLLDTARYLGAEIRRFPRRRENRFQPDTLELQRMVSSRTRLIVLTNLHNPTSARIPESTLQEIAEVAARTPARVLIDEVYLDATFDGALTAHCLHDVIIATSSLTKVYGLAGLRCGWAVAAPDIVEAMWRLNDLFGVIPSHPAERLSLAALKRLPTIRQIARQLLEANRVTWNRFVSGRSELRDGTVEFGTVACPQLVRGSVEEFCSILREQHETTVVPGSCFGMPDSFRVGLGMDEETLAEGLRRLGLALETL
jgi:aspartate/methionine/tyrosine aminotransferase